jgi:hypothetical protein
MPLYHFLIFFDRIFDTGSTSLPSIIFRGAPASIPSLEIVRRFHTVSGFAQFK